MSFIFLIYFIPLTGTYSTGKKAACTVCPSGKECPSTTSDSSQDCSDGYYSRGGQSQCTPCPAGQACPNKDGSGNTFCVEARKKVFCVFFRRSPFFPCDKFMSTSVDELTSASVG